MLKYVRRVLEYSGVKRFNILFKGAPKNYKRILKYLLCGKAKQNTKKTIKVTHIFFKNVYALTATRRAIKRRVAKKIGLQK